MLQDALFVEKENLISALEVGLNRYNEISKQLDTEILKIEDELDTNGKKKFSNDTKRKDELDRRLPVEIAEYNKLKISLEITRLKIKNLTQKIDFLNLKVS